MNGSMSRTIYMGPSKTVEAHEKALEERGIKEFYKIEKAGTVPGCSGEGDWYRITEVCTPETP